MKQKSIINISDYLTLFYLNNLQITNKKKTHNETSEHFCSASIIRTQKQYKYYNVSLAKQVRLPSETYHPLLPKELFTTKDLCQCSALKHE